MKKKVDIEKVKKLLSQKLDQTQIAERLGVKPSAITQALKRAGLSIILALIASNAAADNFTLPSTLGACAAINDGTIYSNISGGNACATANTLSAILDHDITSVRGSILYRSSNVIGWTELTPGTSGNFLETLGAGADPVWAAAGSGTVSSITAGTGITLTPSPITTTGSIAISNTTVTAGSYTSANITVNAQGQITAASNGSGGVSPSPITNSIPSDVTGSNTVYVDTASVAQGSTGTWFAAGQITLHVTTSGSFTCAVKLWDGTNIIDSSQTMVSSSNINYQPVELSGYRVSPAGNIRISFSCASNAVSALSNASGNGKDTTVTAFRIQ